MNSAVLTGDFVRSRQAGPGVLEGAFAVLDGAAERLREWHGAPLRPTRFRGDGWQVQLARPSLALRSALFLSAALKAAEAGLELRLAIGTGAVTRAGGADLSDADGPAFHAAGRALEEMGRGRRLALSAEGAPGLAQAVTVLADAVSQRWTSAQGEALLHALPPLPATQVEIAETLGIRQQSLSERLDAASFWAVSEALEELEAAWPA